MLFTGNLSLYEQYWFVFKTMERALNKVSENFKIRNEFSKNIKTVRIQDRGNSVDKGQKNNEFL